MRPHALLIACTAALGLLAGPGVRPVDRVDPRIGTGAHGHTYPGPTLPFGMVQPGPDTRLSGWDGCSGYHDSDRVIYGFSHTHLSGTGCSDYGDILLVPATGPVRLRSGYRAQGERVLPRDPAGYGSRFKKETERAEAGYYAVTLEEAGVRAELTATLRTGFHRYTFARADRAHVLIDLTHRDEVLASSLRVLDDRTVAGMRRSRAWAVDQPVFFIARFDRPFRATLAVDDRLEPGLREARGTNVKAVLHFNLKPGQAVQAQVALSAVDEEGARKNLEAEQALWAFDRVRSAARKAWAQELDRVVVEGGTAAQQRVFYTALYHAYLQPNLFMDVDGRYLGRDGRIHRATGWQPHTVFSLWDTFRAAHPLYTLLQTRRTGDFLRTFLAQADQGGLLPVWELWGNETDCMIANHAIPVIADAWLKGLRDFDGEAAYQAMKRAALSDRRGLRPYRAFGYVPHDQDAESVSKTLEFAYNDACLARMAEALGHREDRAFFLERSRAYLHLLDPETGLFRPKANGRFLTPFDPAEVNHHYTEANAWQYGFFVPHDLDGHLRRVGGPAAYAALLDRLFAAPSRTTGREQADITGLVGQYAHGNEPSHHVAYLYAYAGQPWKTQAMVKRLRDTLYSDRPDGLCGNEDCGQMSAWFVLSALGFYPVDPCGGTYVIGTPAFRRVTLHLENGKVFTVRARGISAGPYIQSVRLNDRPWDRSWLTHQDLVAGGELAFTLGASPSTWGSAPEARPVSALPAPAPPAPPYLVAGDPAFRGSTMVRLASLDPAARLHFTLDGAQPTPASPVFSTPLKVDREGVLKAIAVEDGRPASAITEVRFKPLPEGHGVRLLTTPSGHYAPPAAALADGLRGAEDFRLGGWFGFEQTHLEAVVDLGRPRELRRLGLGCLQDANAWIFLPTSVAFELSEDGQTWRPGGTVPNPVSPRQEGVVRHDFSLVLKPPQRARYVRVRATSLLTCPDWHKGAGGKAFLFADEVLVEEALR